MLSCGWFPPAALTVGAGIGAALFVVAA